jgi:N4-gp56 family major capsid protein
MAITQLSSVTWDQAAYDRLTYMAFRPTQHFDQFASVQPTRQSMPGSSVIFNKTSDLAVASSALTETSDVTPVAMGDAQVTVTLAEYGNAVQTSAKLRGVSYIPVDPIVAEVIGYNAGVSIDAVAQIAMIGGTNVFFGGTSASQAALASTDIMDAHDVRYARNRLRRGNVPKIGGAYVCHTHPDVTLDLREQTGSGAWRTPHEYAQPGEIWNDEVGQFEGFRFIEDSQATIVADGGAGAVDAYYVLFFGAQALAKAYSSQDGYGPNPQTVVSPVTDALRRFTGMGWKHLVGYSIFRQEAIYRLECSSSVGANA